MPLPETYFNEVLQNWNRDC